MATILKDKMTDQHIKTSGEHSSFESLLGELSAELAILYGHTANSELQMLLQTWTYMKESRMVSI